MKIRGSLIRYFSAPFFVALSFLNIYQPLKDKKKMLNKVSVTTLVLQCLKDIFFFNSVNSLGLYLSPECFLNVLSKLNIPPWLAKIFKYMVFLLLENALNLGIFAHASSPVKVVPEVPTKNMKMNWKIRLFIFVRFVIF